MATAAMRTEWRALWVVALLGAAACSKGYQSEALGLKYEPPAGMALVSEEQTVALGSHGQLKVSRAVFEDGLTLSMVEGLTLPVSASPEEILTAVGVPPPGRRVSSRPGSLGIGPCVRAEFEEAGERMLFYYVPLKDRALIIRYRAPSRAYGMGSAAVERSLGTLALLPHGGR